MCLRYGISPNKMKNNNNPEFPEDGKNISVNYSVCSGILDLT